MCPSPLLPGKIGSQDCQPHLQSGYDNFKCKQLSTGAPAHSSDDQHRKGTDVCNYYVQIHLWPLLVSYCCCNKLPQL